jgi:alkylation response protein AidB-like acyl-CoA dehydrogenase
VLNFGDNDDCIGYLCGEENKGLAHMFQMMNSARLNVGVGGIGIAATAYQNALAYTKERIQGPDIGRRKSGEVPIIDPPDVRRMLLWMKAGGGYAFHGIHRVWLDLAFESQDEQGSAAL